jgi:hypothetical protein
MGVPASLLWVFQPAFVWKMADKSGSSAGDHHFERKLRWCKDPQPRFIIIANILLLFIK